MIWSLGELGAFFDLVFDAEEEGVGFHLNSMDCQLTHKNRLEEVREE